MNAERMNMANATAKIEGSKEARPPGGFPLASAPKKIFICSPYRPTQMTRRQEGTDGGKHPEGKDRLQDSCHNGSPATGSASVFYSVLKG